MLQMSREQNKVLYIWSRAHKCCNNQMFPIFVFEIKAQKTSFSLIAVTAIIEFAIDFVQYQLVMNFWTNFQTQYMY
jgi:hypothetical protein